jgi:polyhydroxyalkanoate synthesis regulator phasin
MTNEEMFNQLMNEIKKIQTTLENEVKPDIQLLIEGHKTLMDNIERSSKATSTVEINEYRIQLLERDLKKLKKEYNMN